MKVDRLLLIAIVALNLFQLLRPEPTINISPELFNQFKNEAIQDIIADIDTVHFDSVGSKQEVRDFLKRYDMHGHIDSTQTGE